MDNNDLHALLEEACINKDVVDKFDGKFMFVERAFEKKKPLHTKLVIDAIGE